LSFAGPREYRWQGPEVPAMMGKCHCTAQIITASPAGCATSNRTKACSRGGATLPYYSHVIARFARGAVWFWLHRPWPLPCPPVDKKRARERARERERERESK
jgi:hypothetical protein